MNPNRDRKARSRVERSWPAVLREPHLERLDEELAKVHRAEQAALLWEASELRLALVPEDLPGWGALGYGDGWDGRARKASFRDRLEEELGCATEDGFLLPPLLAGCRDPDPRSWGEGSALSLAEASLDLVDTPEARAGLVTGLLAEGQVERAEAALSWLEARRWVPCALDPEGTRRRLDLARVFLAEARGELTRALFALESLDPDESTGVSLACGFALGVIEGRPDRACAFLEQLDARKGPTAESSLAFVRARTRVWRAQHPGPLEPACGASVHRALCGPNPLAVAVATALIE
jgi:hypothetical protein